MNACSCLFFVCVHGYIFSNVLTTGVVIEWTGLFCVRINTLKVGRYVSYCLCGCSDLCDGRSSSLVKIEESYDNEDL